MSVKTVYRQGRTEFDGRAFMDYAVRHVVDHADLVNNVARIPIEAGKHVIGLRLRVAEAFTGATQFNAGILTDTDGFIDDGQFDTTVLNNVVSTHMLGTEDGTSGVTTFAAFSKGGKYFTSPDQIVLTFTGTITAGSLVVEVIFDGYEDAPRDMVVNQ